MRIKGPRYVCFAWHDYYPGGGSRDEIGRADTFVEAKRIVCQSRNDGSEIFDRVTGEWFEVCDAGPEDDRDPVSAAARS